MLTCNQKKGGSNPKKASFVYSKIRGGLDWNREDLILYKSYMDLILIIPTYVTEQARMEKG
jgi:hypothetical protein